MPERFTPITSTPRARARQATSPPMPPVPKTSIVLPMKSRPVIRTHSRRSCASRCSGNARKRISTAPMAYSAIGTL